MRNYSYQELVGSCRAQIISVLTIALLIIVTGCEATEPETERIAAPQQLMPAEEEEGFLMLFDGTSLDDWRGYQQEDAPAGWNINELGELEFMPGENGGDLITRNMYENFDLRLEFRISEGGNSGIFFGVVENGYGQAWHTGPEYQILDDVAFPDTERRFRTASNYELHAPDGDFFRGAGAWNEARIVKDGAAVQHWLNDELVLEYELWSDEWEATVAETKFIDYDGYGQYTEGHIGLQDHGDPVWFRNIRIRTW